MTHFKYNKSTKYTDLKTIYAQCSGPGGLKLAEFMAEKMGVSKGSRLLDVGCNRGYQACFLAKEYGLSIVGIDPWKDRMDGLPMSEHLQRNAELWGVENSVLAQQAGMPETNFASNSFDYVYSTTALEMVRILIGEEGYLNCLKEALRVLRPEGILAIGEPMHLDVPLPPDLEPFVSQDEFSWKECFRDIHQTCAAIKSAGFEIIEADYAPDSQLWWSEYAEFDPFCIQTPDEDPKTLSIDNGRWVSFGYIIACKKN
ncbi:cyclopropane-fatty-acyl-phospholipid synthase family protein [Maridesulfovibrio ferrireducens]|uniref:SAM-dependent methyltransferase n=1 Tax=Maridesulfovibrio ferrireducens TaxID=246191 RepID=UPI001A1C5C36|nr:class I SAM-dependent methyltransferase [Maridesulfovibrio ferrireducens]MBI9112208.1 class I SAM-dependent methyltransferase [Maridesulfovibrio ferrireducens]